MLVSRTATHQQEIRRNKMRKHATLLGAVLLAFVSALSYAQAPVPFINLPLMPDATAPGGPQFTLTLNGTGFVSTSVVNWNGTALATQFVSQSQLTATVPAANIVTASTGWVTVVNPAPGGGVSNVAFFSAAAYTGNSVGFGLASSPATGVGPDSLALGDFNGDGKLDLAVANGYSDTVSILLGDGTGNFSLASSPGTPGPVGAVVVGDFNGDGKLDLAVLGNNIVYILLGDGMGNFSLASSLATGNNPDSLAVGDFNRDGKLDLAVANYWGQTVSILLGDGTGNFTLASSPATRYNPRSVAVGDFNGDGLLDLVVMDCEDTWCESTQSGPSILLGDGTGNFTLASSPVTGGTPNAVAVGDFNGDGKLDLAAVDGEGKVFILLGDGAGNFTLASSSVIPLNCFSAVVGDFNGDGKLDLAVASGTSNTISILLGDGAGNLTLASSPPQTGSGSFVVGDFNNDGKPDLAVVSSTSSTVSILLQLPPVAAVTLSPTSLTFGTQLVGTSGSPQRVVLTNTGGAALRISKIAASWNFSQTNNCPSQVPPNGQCTINVTFDPHGRLTQTGTLRIKDDAPNSPQTVPLTGVGTVVTLLPSSLNFADQQVGTTSQPQVATLTNYGTQALNIEGYGIRITGQNAGAFVQTNNCGTSVPAGGSCSISVTFTPKTKGAKTAKLDVGDNGGGSPQSVALSGTGTD
jgi:hypothetical protein